MTPYGQDVRKKRRFQIVLVVLRELLPALHQVPEATVVFVFVEPILIVIEVVFAEVIPLGSMFGEYRETADRAVLMGYDYSMT